MINWGSTENHLLINPRMPDDQRLRFERAWDEHVNGKLHGQVGIATSGSSGDSVGRLIVQSQHALEVSAAAVNKRLQATASDVWVKTLPSFHVGGLGILVRARLNGAKVVESQLTKWDPLAFEAELRNAKGTLLSLVPTQLFDLVQANLKSPPSLRAVVIGGGRLEPDLYRKAREMGWPILPSYGLSECCSQVATALTPNDPAMKPLSHVSIRIGEGERIEIKSESLLTGQIVFSADGSQFVDPKVDGWFRTEDRGEILNDTLRVLGREQDFVKIGGEGVVVSRLEEAFDRARLEAKVDFDCALLAAKDARLGATIVALITAPQSRAGELIGHYNSAVAPYEKIRQVHEVEAIPRSPLGKLLRGAALRAVGLEPFANL